MECSISLSSMPERSIDSRIATPPSSGALKGERAPPNFPKGVRAAPRTTARSTREPPMLETNNSRVYRKRRTGAGGLVEYGAGKLFGERQGGIVANIGDYETTYADFEW